MIDRLFVTLAAGSGAPREARAALRPWLAEHDCVDEQAQVTELLTSELVTNAVSHTESDKVTVSAAMEDDHIHVEVGDCLGHLPLRFQPRPEEPRLRGRGLWLLEALATRWGSDLRDDGKDVWFDVPCAGATLRR
jgi:anti-sigma regulatory factor (Ser/Thr protein kinase)